MVRGARLLVMMYIGPPYAINRLDNLVMYAILGAYGCSIAIQGMHLRTGTLYDMLRYMSIWLNTKPQMTTNANINRKMITNAARERVDTVMSDKSIPIFRERLMQLQGDLSNVDFAKKLGLSRQTIGCYLNGDRVPDGRIIFQICQICGVSADWLLGLSDVRDHDVEAKAIERYTGLSGETIRFLHTWVSMPDDLPSVVENITYEELTPLEQAVFDEKGAFDDDIHAKDLLTFVDRVVSLLLRRANRMMRLYKDITVATQQTYEKKILRPDAKYLIGEDNCMKLERNGHHVISADMALRFFWERFNEILKEEITKSIIADMRKGTVPWKIEMDDEDPRYTYEVAVRVIQNMVDKYGREYLSRLLESK